MTPTGTPPATQQTATDRLQEAARAFTTGDLARAEKLANALIEDDATKAGASKLLGVIRLRQRQPHAALPLLEATIAATPDDSEAHFLAGEAARMDGQRQKAEVFLREALRIDPKMVRAYNVLGMLVAERKDHQTALGLFQKALALSDTPPAGILNNLGNVCRFLGRYSEAEAHFKAAVAAKPDLADAHNNLGILLSDRGQTAAALSHLNTACSAAPSNIGFQTNRLLVMNYDESISPEKLAAAHQEFGDALGGACAGLHQLPLIGPAAGQMDLPDILSIGYMSSDFRSHSVAHFIAPIIGAHDRKRVHITCYANNPVSDATTKDLRDKADRWVDISNLSDDQACQRIREDRIHILVDLNGLTAHNRVGVLARRPAPVQISWIGYPHSVGLRAINYRITDAVADPPTDGAPPARQAFWPGPDAPLRLPDGFLCYQPPADAPPVAAPPCEKTGHITFGSFNNIAKLSPDTVALWAQLLKTVPGSRLMLKSRATGDPETDRLIRKRFVDQGINAERLNLLPATSRQTDHLAHYGDIDIALDTLGYNGTTTTCEALYMGVPVVALKGDRHAARVSASLLTFMGLEALVASSPEDYLQVASRLAANKGALAGRRQQQRALMENSPVMDARRTADQVESAYHTVWRRYHQRVLRMTQPDKANRTPLYLHVGGKQVREGWKILNVQPGDNVDFIGDLADLSAFSDNSVDAVYASHVLEHLGYVKELPAALTGLFRILRPGGRLTLSVPDMDVLALILANPSADPPTKYAAMRILFGGQTDAYDFHKVGLNWTFLQAFLARAGFVDMVRKERLGLFDDSSTVRLAGQAISLNIVARKPADTPT